MSSQSRADGIIPSTAGSKERSNAMLSRTPPPDFFGAPEGGKLHPLQPFKPKQEKSSHFPLVIVSAVLLAIVMVSGLAAFALSEPPANIDRRFAGWFQSLYSPSGEHCCTLADCRRVSYRLTSEGYAVRWGDQWVKVPDEVVVRRDDNPMGEAVVCIRNTDLHVYCFFPAVEG